MTQVATIRSLTVRPIQSADLSFSVSGILDYENHLGLTRLGARVGRYDLTQLYQELGTADDVTGLLQYNSRRMRQDLVEKAGVVLFGVRNLALAAAVDRAIRQRQSAYLRQFKHKAVILEQMLKLYPEESDPGFQESKLGRLRNSYELTKKRFGDLSGAFVEENVLGPVKDTVTTVNGDSSNETSSTNNSKTTTSSTTKSDSTSHSSTRFNQDTNGTQSGTSGLTVTTTPIAYKASSPGDGEQHTISRIYDYSGGDPEDATKYNLKQKTQTLHSLSAPQTHDGAWNPQTTPFVSQTSAGTSSGVANSTTAGSNTGDTTTSGTSSGTATSDSSGSGKSSTTGAFGQKSLTRDFDFRHPSVDNELRYHQRSLELQDEILNQTLLSTQMRRVNPADATTVHILEQLLDNDLAVIDLDVRALQLSFINTLLISPIDGIVTAVYKDLGDSIQAGEPVIRVENEDEILVVGTVNYRGRLDLGKKVNIVTTSAFETGDTITLPGEIVAIRGHEADNDDWEIIIRSDNRVEPGDPKDLKRWLPINYTFDRYDDRIDVLA